jgi:hypothetical protein
LALYSRALFDAANDVVCYSIQQAGIDPGNLQRCAAFRHRGLIDCLLALKGARRNRFRKIEGDSMTFVLGTFGHGTIRVSPQEFFRFAKCYALGFALG